MYWYNVNKYWKLCVFKLEYCMINRLSNLIMWLCVGEILRFTKGGRLVEIHQWTQISNYRNVQLLLMRHWGQIWTNKLYVRWEEKREIKMFALKIDSDLIWPWTGKCMTFLYHKEILNYHTNKRTHPYVVFIWLIWKYMFRKTAQWLWRIFKVFIRLGSIITHLSTQTQTHKTK